MEGDCSGMNGSSELAGLGRTYQWARLPTRWAPTIVINGVMGHL